MNRLTDMIVLATLSAAAPCLAQSEMPAAAPQSRPIALVQIGRAHV